MRGSGSIYQDFNMTDADVRQLKAIFATEIIQTLDRSGLPPVIRTHSIDAMMISEASDGKKKIRSGVQA